MKLCATLILTCCAVFSPRFTSLTTYIADYYRLDELEKLFEVTKDHPYSLLIQMTAFYGLRRSEALGLKWDAIDFERNTITIRHIVTEAEVDGKSVIISEDRAKTKSSLRSLPWV